MPLHESHARNPPFLNCYCKRVKFTTTVVHRKARAQLGSTGSTLCKVADATFRSGVSFVSTTTGSDCPQADTRQRLYTRDSGEFLHCHGICKAPAAIGTSRRAAGGKCYSTHLGIYRVRCRSRVIRVGLPLRRSLPVFPHEQTSAASVGMPQKCQQRTLFPCLNRLEHPSALSALLLCNLQGAVRKRAGIAS